MLAGGLLMYIVCSFAALNWHVTLWHPVIRLAYCLMLFTLLFQPIDQLTVDKKQ